MGLETQLWYLTRSPEEMHKKGGEHLAHYTQLLKYFNGKLVLPLGPHIILAASSFYPADENAKLEVHPTDFWPSLGSSGIFHLEIKILIRKGASQCWGAWNNIWCRVWFLVQGFRESLCRNRIISGHIGQFKKMLIAIAIRSMEMKPYQNL